jgi:hypothetical protein
VKRSVLEYFRVDSERGLLIVLFSIPLALAVVTFLIVVASSVIDHKGGSGLWNFIAVCYAYLLFFALAGPSYGIACVWWWWQCRSDDENVVPKLMRLPWTCALFCWFPALTFSVVPLQNRLQLFPIYFVLALFFGYIWVLILRGIVLWWQWSTSRV